ncbi:DUF4148 domain-containing protein [Polaromonas sp. P1(28)-13]|nr:DUF4148 domain-containing protein [Polaromonas sp. P1(28)-13]
MPTTATPAKPALKFRLIWWPPRTNGQYAALESDSHAVFFTEAGKSAVTRDQVRSEASAARANGAQATLASDSFSVFFPAVKANKS